MFSALLKALPETLNQSQRQPAGSRESELLARRRSSGDQFAGNAPYYNFAEAYIDSLWRDMLWPIIFIWISSVWWIWRPGTGATVPNY